MSAGFSREFPTRLYLSRSTQTGQTGHIAIVNTSKNKMKMNMKENTPEEVVPQGCGHVRILHHQAVGASGQNKPLIITLHDEVISLQSIWTVKVNTAYLLRPSMGTLVCIHTVTGWVVRKYHFLLQIDTRWWICDEPTLMTTCNSAAGIISGFKGWELSF